MFLELIVPQIKGFWNTFSQSKMKWEEWINQIKKKLIRSCVIFGRNFVKGKENFFQNRKSIIYFPCVLLWISLTWNVLFFHYIFRSILRYSYYYCYQFYVLKHLLMQFCFLIIFLEKCSLINMVQQKIFSLFGHISLLCVDLKYSKHVTSYL